MEREPGDRFGVAEGERERGGYGCSEQYCGRCGGTGGPSSDIQVARQLLSAADQSHFTHASLAKKTGLTFSQPPRNLTASRTLSRGDLLPQIKHYNITVASIQEAAMMWTCKQENFESCSTMCAGMRVVLSWARRRASANWSSVRSRRRT